ncbi:hypothetical protein CFH99_07880 [Nocardioides aromaticivorans]|uniref:Uncharacterized protein n=1 Tax=Nocardioides aromaticivorans TaxID=200618 RepID=A0ABX7PIP3_9ACTN|nr:hypothetical protein [Nocardioides aromaticivorans]QSR25540.1 hypothetical protein CFH99_07880 [Nocardioides aromaticivorans]
MPLDEAQRLHLAFAVYSVTGYRPPNGESDLSSVRNEIEHYVDHLLREHTERALADVEGRINQRASEIGRTSAVGRFTGLCEAAELVRAARQEQNR